MHRPLHVLHIEDSEDDAALVLRELRLGGYDPLVKRVAAPGAMQAALRERKWDLVLADWALPQFNPLFALEQLKCAGLDLPFIIVSGTIGEETAVTAMKAGAHDYVMKNNLTRLVPAIEREMLDAEIRGQRKKAEESLKRSESFLRAVIASALDAVIRMDAEGRITDWNSQAKTIFGWTDYEAIGRMFSETIIPAHDRAAHVQRLQHFLSTGEGKMLNRPIEVAALRRDGREITVELSIVPLAVGTDHSFTAFVRDITERSQRERHQAMDHALSKILLTSHSLDDAGPNFLRTICSMLDWNMGTMWKTDEEAQVLRHVDTWADEQTRATEFFTQTGHSSLAKGVGLPGRVWESHTVEWIPDVKCDGNCPRAPYAITAGLHAAFAFPIMHEQRVHGVMEFFSRDTREPDPKLLDLLGAIVGRLSQFVAQKETERDLRIAKEEAEQAAREKAQILSAAHAFFICLDEQDCVKEWSSDAETLFGLPLENVLGQPFQRLAIGWDWQDIGVHLEHTRRTMKEVRLDKVRLQGPTARDRYLRLTMSALRVEPETRMVLMGEDVTERVQLEHELAQAQKLESIGHLASGIAHEINTPIQFIGDNLHFFSDSIHVVLAAFRRYEKLLAVSKEGLSPSELIDTIEAENQSADLAYLMTEIPRAIAQSMEGVERISKIVRAMKEFAHPGKDEKIPVNLNAAIESTATVARNEWKYVAELTMDLDPALPPVPCLVGEFNQVILNMIVNAAHAIVETVKDTANKGHITISTRGGADWVEIRIRDTGAGIPEAIQHKIFDPFFTTKEVGKGTGQGLAIARSVIVDKHAGTIALESEVGKGTTFTIRLPLQSTVAQQETEPRR